MMSDKFGIRLKMFLIVKLRKLGGQNFELGLYWKIFSFEKERSFGTRTHSNVTVSGSF
jgi:hypothetical protein